MRMSNQRVKSNLTCPVSLAEVIRLVLVVVSINWIFLSVR